MIYSVPMPPQTVMTGFAIIYRDLPPLTWLRAFEAAARRLSFTAAAQELHLTQAAVSKHVKSLEARLRQPLFIRHPRSLELTRWAEAYLPKVQDALERLSSGTREVFGRPGGAEVLTLHCAVSFAANWLAPRLPQWLAAHPGTPLRILSSVWADPVDATNCDLAIQYGTGVFGDATAHRLTRERLTPLCTPALAARLSHPDDLAGQRLIHVQGYQDGWGTWATAAGAHQIDPGQGIQTDTTVTALALAVAGAGVALGRDSMTAPYLAAGTLVAPFTLSVPVEEGFFLINPKRSTPAHPSAECFAAWAITTAGGITEEG
jgi:LysR family glycine cleavage system transcriptional activator